MSIYICICTYMNLYVNNNKNLALVNQQRFHIALPFVVLSDKDNVGYIDIYVYMCMYVYIHVCVHTYTHTHISVFCLKLASSFPWNFKLLFSVTFSSSTL